MSDTASKKYQLTINNYAEKGLDYEQIKNILSKLKTVVYYCMSKEIGLENKTPHIHLFIACKSALRFSTLKKRFPEAHIEAARGTSEDNRDYVAKSGKWANDEKAETSVPDSFDEWGEMPEEPGQGFRSDIAQLYTLIESGLSNAEIMQTNPDFALQIGKMDKIRQDILEERYKTVFREITTTYIFGATGTGKTRYVMENSGYDNVYRVTDYKHPFDGYKQENTICFDEFRSSLLIGDMLTYLDGYPLALPARYANRQACYTEVYLISNIDLKLQYFNVQDNEPATWKAFLRRIHKVIEYHPDGSSTDHGSGLDYYFDTPEPEEIKQEELPF